MVGFPHPTGILSVCFIKMTPEQYCYKKAVKTGSSLYYSMLYLPEKERNAATALLAFCIESRAIVTQCTEPAIAHSKLDWWRSELDRCFNGQAQHPVSKALLTPLQTWNLPQEYFHEILDSVQMDLQQHHYQTLSELALYCYRTSGVASLLLTEVYGYHNRNTVKYAQSLGTALQLTRILKNIHADVQQGRMYIPLETLHQFDTQPDDLLQKSDPNQFRPLFEHLVQQASDYFDQAFAQLADEDRYNQRQGLIQAAIYQALLKEIAADGYHLLDQQVSLTPVRKFWIAWNVNRREKRNRNHSLKIG